MNSMRELTGRFLALYPPMDAIGLRLGDVRVDVRSNSPALLSTLTSYFRDFLGAGGPARFSVTALEAPAQDLSLDFAIKEPEPGKTRIKEEFHDFPDGRVVRKRLTGMLFLFGGGAHMAVGPCLEHYNQVVNFINNRYIELLLNRGGLLGHAAGVSLSGRGLALAGFSGMGKSTLALHMMEQHDALHFVSNDRLVIERAPEGPVMHGVAKMPRVNPGTVLHNERLAPLLRPGERERFMALPPDALWHLEHKYDAFIDVCFGPGRFDLTAQMKGLALLNWCRDAGPLVAREVDLAERRDLLPAFMKSTGLFYEAAAEDDAGAGDADGARGPDFSEEAYIDALRGIRVVELSGGVDFKAGAAACLDLLRGD